MSDLLMLSLEVAVPLAIDEVRTWTPEERVAYCRQHADVIASRGDDLMFGSKKKGETGKLLVVLARCLACLAFSPGGVEFAGMRWEVVDHVDAEATDAA